MRAAGPNTQALAPIHPLVALLLLWLAGTALRLTILAVPPVIPQIHADLHLSKTEVGVLSGLPSVLFAGAAVAGSLLIAQVGAIRALLVGLVLCAAGSALRGAASGVPFLYAATIVMALGVAFMQPALPPLVRDWVPHRIGFATAVYTNGLLVGEILPAALTIPLVLPLVHGSWRWSFVFWALPVVAIAIAVAVLAPRSTGAAPTSAAQRRWWPDWKSGLLWRLGLMLGCLQAIYFGTNAFMPDYLNHIGRPDLVSAALTALNLGQLPASFLLLRFAGRLQARAWPFAVLGLAQLASVLGILLLPGVLIVAASALVGFLAGATLVLMFVLPPLLSPPDDVHRMSAGMFTISYSCAVIVPVISGLAWDLTGIASLAFIPMAVCALGLLVLVQGVDFARGSQSKNSLHPRVHS